MYDCPNCGGNLKFDIKTQQLLCDFCHSTLDPYELEAAGAGMEVEETAVPAEDAAEEQGRTSKRKDLLQMTVFTCPACGAEIASTNLSATGFCTYCGASAVFKKRVRGELRPQKIIPFQKTKEDCKAAYGKAVGSNFYAVKELKDPAFLDQFVGVYMPYWSYDISAGPDIRVDGIKTHKKGNYLYTDHYDLKCSVDAGFRQISYDASSAFDDRIHEGIAPFEEDGIKPFTPGYMAGFYADIADVPSEIYQDDAEAAVGKEIYDKLEDQFPAYTISTPGSLTVLERNLKLKTETSRAMFPVWFLTYRKDDRVAYAVVNGQTGKVYADVPVDTAKFLLVSLGLAIPLFILANLFLTITAPWMLTLAGIFAAFTALIFDQEMSVIKRHEQKLEDAGYIAVTKPQSSEAKALTKDGIKKAKFEDDTAANVLTVIMCSIIVFLAAFDYIFMAGDFLALHFNGVHGIVAAFVLIITLVFSFKAAGTAREILKPKKADAEEAQKSTCKHKNV